jgi:hypothetical protein
MLACLRLGLEGFSRKDTIAYFSLAVNDTEKGFLTLKLRRVKGDTQRSIECFRRALAVSPNNAEVLLNLVLFTFALNP